MPEDNLLAAFIRAIAWELVQLGYRPSDQPRYLRRDDGEPLRLVAEEVWQAVNAIMAGREDAVGSEPGETLGKDSL
ncbi:MAG TPA: hypothetical protein VN649_18560 [Ramlibacter sp.]|nr:hypothetical protein [Ramlibacter sp.]